MSFSAQNSANNFAYLDILRSTKGYEAFKSDFYDLANSSSTQALEMLNDSRLRFTSLYLLIPEIHTFNFYLGLNTRNISALNTCAKVLGNEVVASSTQPLISQNNEIYKEKEVLSWMFESAYQEDGLNDEFDELIDGVVALLIIDQKNKAHLPTVAKLMFARNRKASFNHDLIWIFFQVREVECIELIAQYLESPDEKDVKFAAKLLHLRKDVNIKDNSEHHKTYLRWLKENYGYLYFTGESYQQTSNPELISVDLDAKYLGKSILAANRQMLSPLNQEEKQHLNEFKQMNTSQQVSLSNFSQTILNQHRGLWSRWSSYPLSKQMEIAQSGIGGARWL